MSGNRNRNRETQSQDNFSQYRELAPEAIEDVRIREIMKLYQNNKEKILAAIENLWHDVPERVTVGSEWVTLQKKNVNGAPGNSVADNKTGSTDNRGRGRSVPPGGRDSGGRGGGRSSSTSGTGGRGGGGRGAGSSSRPSSKPTTVIKTDTRAYDNNFSSWSGDTGFSSSNESSANKSSQPAAWGSGVNLAERLKRKQAAEEEERLKAAAEPEKVEEVDMESYVVIENNFQETFESQWDSPSQSVPEADDNSSDLFSVTAAVSDMRFEKEIEIIEEDTHSNLLDEPQTSSAPAVLEEPPLHILASTSTLPIAVPSLLSSHSSAISHVSQVQQNVQAPEEVAPAVFVKMGKWDAAPAASFQFGSFGSIGGSDESVPSQSAWGSSVPDIDSGRQTSDSSAEVWNTQNSTSIDSVTSASNSSAGPISSLFPQAKSISQISSEPANSIVNQSKFDHKPPGLGDPHSNTINKIANSPKTPVVQQQQQQQQQVRASKHELSQPQQHSVYSQYPVPPGISAPGVRGNIPAATANIPYYSSGQGYDAVQPQAQYLNTSSYQAAAVPSSVTNANQGVATTSNSQNPPSVSPSNTPSSQQPTQQQIPPQQFAPAHYGFYNMGSNPYYPNQYYFNPAQMPGFYNPSQNRAMYGQPPRGGPYGADPYSNQASALYPDQYSQYPESAGSYNAMGMHPGNIGHQNPSLNINTASTGAPNTSNKAPKGTSGSASSSSQQNTDHVSSAPQHHYGGYPMQDYNQRAGNFGLQYQQMGYPMMNNNYSPSNLGPQSSSGFGQGPQGSSPQQQQQQQQPQGGRDNQNRTSTGGGYGGQSYGSRAPQSGGGAPQQSNW